MKLQEIFAGFGSHKKIPEILGEYKNKILLVCDNSFPNIFISGYIKTLDYSFIYFSGFTPNPVYEDIEKGAALFKKEGCEFIISIGGGSSIDVAKCINLFAAQGKAPHLAIPTTSGTGSESTHFAVMYKDGEKQSVADSALVPDFVILDPGLLRTVPDYQKKSTLLDALCQAVESSWSVKSTPESRKHALGAISLILPNITGYLNNEDTALEQIMQASNLSGQAINISETTAAHAMSYKISSLFGFAHGHAAALCLPAVLNYMTEHPGEITDTRGEAQLFGVYRELAEAFGFPGIRCLSGYLSGLLDGFGLQRKVPLTPETLNELTDSVNIKRLSNNPVNLSKSAIKKLYSEILS